MRVIQDNAGLKVFFCKFVPTARLSPNTTSLSLSLSLFFGFQNRNYQNIQNGVHVILIPPQLNSTPTGTQPGPIWPFFFAIFPMNFFLLNVLGREFVLFQARAAPVTCALVSLAAAVGSAQRRRPPAAGAGPHARAGVPDRGGGGEVRHAGRDAGRRRLRWHPQGAAAAATPEGLPCPAQPLLSLLFARCWQVLLLLFCWLFFHPSESQQCFSNRFENVSIKHWRYFLPIGDRARGGADCHARPPE